MKKNFSLSSYIKNFLNKIKMYFLENRLFFLLISLFKEAGLKYSLNLTFISISLTLLDFVGIGLLISLLFKDSAKLNLINNNQLSNENLIFLILIIFLIKNLFKTIAKKSQKQIRDNFTDNLREELLSSLVNSKYENLTKVKRGDIVSLLISDINRSGQAVDSGIRSFQRSFSFLIYSVGLILYGSLSLSIIILGILANALSIFFQKSNTWELGNLQSLLNSSIQRTVGDGIHGLKAIKASSAEDWIIRRFSKENQLVRNLHQKLLIKESLFVLLRDFFFFIFIIIWVINSGNSIGFPQLLTTLILAYKVSVSAGSLVESGRSLLAALPGYKNLTDLRKLLITEVSNTKYREDNLCLDQSLHSLSWVNKDTDFKKEISLERGKLTVITGASGSGKTNLIDKFCGMLNSNKSKWEFYDKDYNLIFKCKNNNQFKKYISYAPQNTILFETSLQENLLLKQLNKKNFISREMLMKYFSELKLNHLLDRKGGLNQDLYMSISTFSGGEIQRLGVIRALVKERPIEIFDEPTAFLDKDLSLTVNKFLKERSKNKLMLIATHDFNLIERADKVITI